MGKYLDVEPIAKDLIDRILASVSGNRHYGFWWSEDGKQVTVEAASQSHINSPARALRFIRAIERGLCPKGREKISRDNPAQTIYRYATFTKPSSQAEPVGVQQ